MAYYDLDRLLTNYLRQVQSTLSTRPVVLGGMADLGGGTGGPPGGFIGFLPQSRIAYDLSEDASNVYPASGYSLVTNLNHIRYRLNVLEASGVGGSGGGSGIQGPVSSTDNAIARWDGTNGKLLQNSLITITDVGSISIPTGQTYNINGSPHTHAVPKLDDLAAPDNNTDLNVSITAHGLMPILPNDASKFINGTGNWITVSGTGTTVSGIKITELPLESSPNLGDILVLVHDPNTSPITEKVTISGILDLSNNGNVYGNDSVVDGHLAVFDADGYHLKDGGAIPSGISSGIGAKVRRTTSLSIPSDTAIPFDNEVWDTDGIHDPFTYPERLTCKTPGYYIITAGAGLAADGTSGLRQIYIIKNGTDVLAVNGFYTTSNIRFNVAVTDYLNINDYLELHMYQDTGHGIALMVEDYWSPIFGIQKVG